MVARQIAVFKTVVDLARLPCGTHRRALRTCAFPGAVAPDARPGRDRAKASQPCSDSSQRAPHPSALRFVSLIARAITGGSGRSLG